MLASIFFNLTMRRIIESQADIFILQIITIYYNLVYPFSICSFFQYSNFNFMSLKTSVHLSIHSVTRVAENFPSTINSKRGTCNTARADQHVFSI